jgi:hypothetical protein
VSVRSAPASRCVAPELRGFLVGTISVGQTPEGIQASPDSRFAAVTVMNGSNKPPGSPFHGPGLVRMLRVADGRLSLASEAHVGT